MDFAFNETSLYDSLNCLVIRLDRQMNIWFMNRFGLGRLGYERLEQLFGKSLQTVLLGDEAKNAELLRGVKNLPQQECLEQIESELLHCDGSRIPISWTLNYLGEGVEQIAPTLLIGFDASSIHESRAVAAMFQTISDNYTGSIVITDSRKKILYVNPAFLRMTGYAIDEIIGQTPALFKSGQTSDDIYRDLWETLESGNIWKGEFVNHRKDGTQFLESKTISAIRDARGSVQYYFAIGEDLSQRLLYQKRIDSLLAFDQLTGLPNRSAFLRALTGTLDSARQSGKEATIMHVDIDDFLVVSEADQVIVEMAARIKDVLRQTDQLARLGNDKFGILFGPHPSSFDDDIHEIAGRVLEAIRKPVLLVGKLGPIQVTASIGIASHPNDSDNANELLSHAMKATAYVKANGGDNFRRFDAAFASHFSGRRELLNELKQAISCGEMVLHFQPQVSLLSGAIIGMEALVRWQHPQRGLIPPSEFIPLAESSSLIIDLGEWVLHETCRQMRVWQDCGLPAVKVAINLAARHFLVPELHTIIADALVLQRIDARFLEIEITEGAMMQDVTAAIRSTTQLKEVGVRISLDDFGTGYSSLAYLSRFPIDVVKIDQSFIRDITTNPVNAAIAQATIAMSHKLGKAVLAEGVETEEQMQYLRRNECDEMQGYFFSRPLPAEGIVRLLQDGSMLNFSSQRGADTRRSTVLLVDDEANILTSLKRTLRREGYEVLTATSAAEGFSLLAKNPVQLIISDQRMPEMNGTEFLSRVKNLYPETVRMVLSGYSEITAVTDSINKGAVYRFMLKPWDDDVLKKEINDALRHWRELYGSKNETRNSFGS